jgi:nucleoside-diphosphate-sugar epimerase
MGPKACTAASPLPEDDPIAPQSLYGQMKLVNEEIGRQYADKYGFEVVLIRPTAILGWGTTMWPETLIAQPATGHPTRIDSSSARYTNGLAISDMADLFAKVLMAARVQHDCYLASGHAFTWGEIAGLVRKHVPEAAITFDESAPARAGGFAYLCDNSRAVKEFDWQVHSLEETVLMTIKWGA